jgi:lipoyl(octanoyl) transferase
MDNGPRTRRSPKSTVQSPKSIVHLLDLGVVEYGQALEMQRGLVRRRQADEIPDTLVLLEHPPVITLGRNADRKNLLVSDAELARRGVTLVKVERGGDITFHGPGQLVGYPVFRLGSGVRDQGSGVVGVRWFVDSVQQALVLALAELGVRAEVREKYVGVWTRDEKGRAIADCRMQNAECRMQEQRECHPERSGAESKGLSVDWRKVASIGVAVSRHVTFHGFALNVSTDLSWFGLMNPCGFSSAQMTSVAREGGTVDMAVVRRAVVRGFESAFGRAFAAES